MASLFIAVGASLGALIGLAVWRRVDRKPMEVSESWLRDHSYTSGQGGYE
jgi:hypothetical protein